MSNQLLASKIVTGGDMSANITSSVYSIGNVDNVALHLVWTGSPTGTFAVQASVDGVDWVPLSLPTSPAAAGGASSALVELTQMCASQLRVVYTFGSGTGVLTITAHGKEF